MITTCTSCGRLYEAGSEEQAYEAVRLCGGTRCSGGGSDLCHETVSFDGGEIYCYRPNPCPVHSIKKSTAGGRP